MFGGLAKSIIKDVIVSSNFFFLVKVRNCELDGLHDLDHSQLYVRKKVINYLNTLLKLGVGGFR